MFSFIFSEPPRNIGLKGEERKLRLDIEVLFNSVYTYLITDAFHGPGNIFRKKIYIKYLLERNFPNRSNHSNSSLATSITFNYFFCLYLALLTYTFVVAIFFG